MLGMLIALGMIIGFLLTMSLLARVFLGKDAGKELLFISGVGVMFVIWPIALPIVCVIYLWKKHKDTLKC